MSLACQNGLTMPGVPGTQRIAKMNFLGKIWKFAGLGTDSLKSCNFESRVEQQITDLLVCYLSQCFSYHLNLGSWMFFVICMLCDIICIIFIYLQGRRDLTPSI